MKNVLKYKGYPGTVGFDAHDRIFHGRLMGITDIITLLQCAIALAAKREHKSINAWIAEVCAQNALG
jgi:predicted HicB family RNase H-like nuclease